MGWSPPRAPALAVVIELQPLEESLAVYLALSRCTVEHCGAQALSTRSYKEPSNVPATFLGLGQSLGHCVCFARFPNNLYGWVSQTAGDKQQESSCYDGAIAGTGSAQGVQGPCRPMAEGREAEAARLLLHAGDCAGAWPELWQ